MDRAIAAVWFNGLITAIHLIKSKLIEKVMYNRRKPLRGEHTSHGVIKTDSLIKGTINMRLTNNTAPFMLYLITGKQTLRPIYENLPQFSLIEVTDEIAYEKPNLYVTKFAITQEEKSPLIIEGYSRAEYEPNRYGRFTININNCQFEKMLESNGYYRNQCYGDLILESYIQE